MSVAGGTAARGAATRAGTGSLVRLALRRDRVRLAIWLLAIPGLVYVQAVGIIELYPDQADLAAAGRLVEGNAAFIAMAGPPLALDTIGGRVTFEISSFGMVLAALMNVFLVTRHVRGEEESGRAELLRSSVVGRHAAVTAALTVALLASVVLGGLVTFALVVPGLALTGSLALAACISGVGLLFGAVAAVTSQLTTSARAASGMAGALLAASFVLRAVGDIGSGALSWLSPLGWGQALRPFAGERWWPLALILGSCLALVAVAYVVNSHRDVGAGVIGTRPGPPRAGAGLVRPIGLAVRLQRGAVVAWGVGLLLGGLAYGSVAGDVEDLVADSEDLAAMLAQGGGDLVEGFLATAASVLALIGTGFSIQAVLRLRGEEQTGRAEAVLATAVSRPRWGASHVAVAVGGTVVVLVAAGLGTGVAYALVAGGWEDVPRILAAALVQVPAVLVLVGVAAALYGLVPRAAPLAWAALAVCFVVGFFGEILSLPGAVRDVSPFEHVPRLPAADFEALPVVVLLVIAAALVALGGVGLRRRDLRT